MVTLVINEKSMSAKAFLAFAKTLPFVEIQEEVNVVAEEQSPYNKEFVAKIKKAQKEIKKGKGTVIDPKDVWGSLGLK